MNTRTQTLILKGIKTDLQKHWALWTGIVGFIVIGVTLDHYGTSSSPMAYLKAQQLSLAFISWLFCCIGLFWIAQEEKAGNYIPDKEMNEPYE